MTKPINIQADSRHAFTATSSTSIHNIASDDNMSELPELSVVMPCLNEADTVGICVEKAVRAHAGAWDTGRSSAR